MSTTASSRTAGAPGLFGSTIGEHQVRSATAELVGTAVLVFVGTSAAVAGPVMGIDGFGSLGVALAFGLTLVALVASLGHVSGCHLNPAVTVGLAAVGRFPWRLVPVYVVAQLVGGLLGAAATWVSYGERAREVAALSATLPNDGVSQGRALVVEALVTFILVLVVVSVATDDRVPGAVAPLAVGFALAAAIFVAGPLTGGAVNPARAFGPNVLSGELGPLWLYFVGPVIGGVAAALLYVRVLERTEAPS